jgi:hypothetical protein
MAIVWVDAQYGSGCTATIVNGLNLHVKPYGVATRDCPAVPYVVTVFEATLKRKFADRGEAKTAAEGAARKFLRAAINNAE